MFQAIKVILIKALMTWTIEIIKEKSWNFQKKKVWFNMSPPGGHTLCGELHFVVYHSNRATIKYGFSLKTILIMAWTFKITHKKCSKCKLWFNIAP